MSTSPESVKIKKVITDPESIKITRIFSLDNVIHEISATEINSTRDAIKNTSKKIVILNPNSKEVVRKTTVTVFHRHYKYYLVSTQDKAQGKTEYEIENPLSSGSVTILISYDIQCELGKEENLAQALCSDHSVTDSLNLMIKRFIQVFMGDLRSSGIAPGKDFNSYKEKLTGDLKRFLSNQAGLHADILLSVKGEEFLKDITLNLDSFNVRVTDYNEALTLQVEMGLDIDNSNRNAAIPYISQPDSLKDFLIEQIKRYLLENISLHQFVYQLNGTVKNELMEMLERALQPKGRKLSWLQINTKINFELPKQNINMHYSVFCDISDYSPRIEVEHKLLLQLGDLGMFKATPIPMSIEEWVEETLNTITKNELFYQRYVDILLDFVQEDPEKQRTLKKIKEQMQRQASTVGYTVKHLIVKPNIKILDLTFMVEIKEEVFSTLINRVNVTLGIVVQGKLTDLSKLHDYITPDKIIEKEMEHMILLEAKKLMHTIDPQEFYMPFKGSVVETAEDKLRTAITKIMTDQFHAHDVKITIKKIENDQINRILDLVNGSPYCIEFEVVPLRGGGLQEPVKFEVEFLIQSITNWNTFIYKNFDLKTGEEIQKIKDVLQRDIKSKFITVPYPALRYSSIEGANKILELARKSHAKISSIFGLEINIINLTREPTMTELEMHDILKTKIGIQTSKEKRIAQKEAETEIRIHENMQNVLLRNTNPETAELAQLSEINDITYAETQIKKIKEKSLVPGVEEAYRSQVTLPEKIDEWCLDDYADELIVSTPAYSIDEAPNNSIGEDKSDSYYYIEKE
ncbi:MAG: hypothetical protein ACM3SY_07195 [Candidatus Omnitrophota bacterium]